MQVLCACPCARLFGSIPLDADEGPRLRRPLNPIPLLTMQPPTGRCVFSLLEIEEFAA